MRYLFIVVLGGALGVGCRTPQVAVRPQVSGDVEVEDWKGRCLEAREREEALAVRLAAAESALEQRAQERVEAAQLTHMLEVELSRSAVERHLLSEHNAQLMSRQRELSALQEELEDVWYQSALSRARRRIELDSHPEPPHPAPAITP